MFLDGLKTNGADSKILRSYKLKNILFMFNNQNNNNEFFFTNKLR